MPVVGSNSWAMRRGAAIILTTVAKGTTMPNDDLIAALERAAAVLSWETPADAATIRALIDDLSARNLVRREDVVAQERAKVVAWLRKRGDCWSTDDEIADAIAAAAHEGGGGE